MNNKSMYCLLLYHIEFKLMPFFYDSDASGSIEFIHEMHMYFFCPRMLSQSSPIHCEM